VRPTPRTLFEAATQRGRVIRQGEIVSIVMDGGGQVVVPGNEFIAVQKWSQSKPYSGNLLTDRARFLDQFTALVSRPLSVQPTRGNERQVERLVRAMRQAGYDIAEWQVPPEMKDPMYWRPKLEGDDKDDKDDKGDKGDKDVGKETPPDQGGA
jgi:hypothetical protein